MASNPVIQKCDSSRPYRNNVVTLLTTPHNYQTIDTYVEPTGTFANSIFSPSGEMDLGGRFNHPGQIVHNV